MRSEGTREREKGGGSDREWEYPLLGTQIQREGTKLVEGSDRIYGIAGDGDEYMGAELRLRYIRAMRITIYWGPSIWIDF